MSDCHSGSGKHCHKHHHHASHERPAEQPSGLTGKALAAWRYVGFLVWRNRFAIAIASLVWLIWRSGTQPRRLAYPCQQAAAANLGFLAVLLIPEAARRHAARRKPGRRAFALATGSVALAGVLSLLISAGVLVHSQWAMSNLAVSIPPPETPAPEARVAIAKTDLSTLTAADVEALVRKAVADAGGLQDIVKPGDVVSIKPNLVNDNTWTEEAPTGVTTDPRVVAAIVKLVKEAGAGAVRIVEGAAGPYYWNTGYLGRGITWLAFRECGYDRAENGGQGDGWFDYDPSVELIDLNDAGYVNNQGDPDLVPRGDGTLPPNVLPITPPNTVLVELPNGVIRTKYYVPKTVVTPEQGGDCDVFISVPTLKNHSNGSVTGALKNRVGCAPSDIYHVTTYIPDHYQQMKWDLVHWAVPGGPIGGTIPFPRDVTHTNPGPPTGTSQLIENITVNYSIVDLNLVRPNDFAVVDGLVGITNGPTGENKPNPYMKLIMASKDSVAVDTIGALLMGYDPMESLQIGWAWNRGLGNRDITGITVVGEHVDAIRRPYVTGERQFPCGYAVGGNVCVEAVQPTITDVQPTDNSTVYDPEVIVTGSGISDGTGVAKAELEVTFKEGLNLVVNGDFEAPDPSTGWTTWKAFWSMGQSWEFNNTEPGHLGNGCLKFGTNHQASLGVYQEVPVTPGKTYKVDAYWKGQKFGSYNWYEILLIDGPFSIAEADSGGEPMVRANYMYAYDSNTFPMPGDFGWIWAHELNSPPDNEVDWNNRKGLRTATGDTMTVVLKCGASLGTYGAAAWFDNVTLTEVGTGESELVDTLAWPSDPFDLVWESNDHPDGYYDLKVTVYDPFLNEASITRTNILKVEPIAPLIKVNPTPIEKTMQFGDPDNQSQFTISNGGVGTLRYRFEVDQTWLSVNPTEGESDGEEDLITVSFDIDGMTVGTNHANIVVLDNGSTPQEARNAGLVIPVTLILTSVAADNDQDGDVDQEDWAAMQICLGGELMPFPAGCEKFDFQKDNDVDWADVVLWRQCFSGPGVYAPAACDDNYP